MESKDKRQSIKVRVEGGLLYFATPAGNFTFNPAGASDEAEEQACIKGWKEKISNVAAMPAGTSWKVKLDAMVALKTRLETGGPWNLKASAASSLNRACLFAAVAAVRNLAPETVALKWQDKPDEVLKAALTHRDVAAEYARLTASGPEDTGLFEGLED